MELWRIEDMKPVKQAQANGKFHIGDSYILLCTTLSKSNKLQWAIHFWLGSESSQDESGVAAYKTVELDNSLGGSAVQYRELQDSESTLFLSYFKHTGGIEYLPGGVDSGFTKVERDVYETRMLHCKGKRTVRVHQVPIALTSLNKGDVFILDAGLKIYLFFGPTANKYERTKGSEVVQHIKDDERGGRAEVIHMSDHPEEPGFWEPLGGFTDPHSLPEGEPDADVDVTLSRKLFQISDESGSLQFIEVPSAKAGCYNKSQLDTNDVFLLQSSHGNKVYLWIGRKSTLNEKKESTLRAVQYIKEQGLPANTAIERVSEGCETNAFKSEFTVWDPPRHFGMSPKASTGGDEGFDAEANVAELMARKKVEDTPVDDGSGKLTVWAIKDFKKEPVDPQEYGHFFGGDSYILLYSYLKDGRTEEHIIYFWLGNDSTADEKGAAALLTVELDDSMGGKPVQVRVTQGKEPAHFRQLFQGKMIVFRGGNVSGFRSSGGETAQEDAGDVAMFHIKGTTALNTCAVEVTPAAASLNSEDSFVIVTSAYAYVWHGLGANEDEVTVATGVATTLAGSFKGLGGREVVNLQEGDEPAEFWETIGGKAEYPSMAAGEAPPKDPRLYSASTATGKFKVEEIDNFDQSDLNDEDVYLLDTYTQLFVWVGTQSTQEEKTKALEFATQYVTLADDGRDPDIPIIRFSAGDEPAMFTCHFLGWDDDYLAKRSFKDPYLARQESMKMEKDRQRNTPNLERRNSLRKTPSSRIDASNPASPAPATPAAAVVEEALATPVASVVASSYPDAVPGSFSLDDLKAGLPDGVDPTRKEQYLDDAAFAECFSMDRAKFDALPKWKRDAAKKKAGLF